VNSLEYRRLMSTGSRAIGIPDLDLEPPPPTIPVFHHLPRTGGVSVQVGAVVGIGVGQPHGNTAQIDDDGSGNFTAEWNGGPSHSFAGVQAVGVFAERARNNEITINLGDLSAGSPEAQLRQTERADAVDREAGAHPSFGRQRTSGSGIQTGTTLSVIVNKPTSNQAVILDQGGGAVEVEWNGGAVHSFTGVTTIVVNSARAKNDSITFYTPPLT
jgi:hypothetical protein